MVGWCKLPRGVAELLPPPALLLLTAASPAGALCSACVLTAAAVEGQACLVAGGA